MNTSKRDVVVSSRIRLARNYEDLPFSPGETARSAESCSQRTLEALSAENAQADYILYRMNEMDDVERYYLAEKHLISFDLIRKSETGSAYIRKDEQVSIMMNEEDHLRIQAIAAGEDLSNSALMIYRIEDALQKHVRFAFDTKLGYLTACPTNAGTGMRASLMLHLPMLTADKQMGIVNQTVAKLGLIIRGIYGEGSEALGHLYQISNQATLGRTEEEIIRAVLTVGDKLIDMERALRLKAHTMEPVKTEDQIFRSYGLLKYSRSMPQKEFLSHWSNLRLGISLGRLPVTMDSADILLEDAQDAHVMKWAGSPVTGDRLDERRCARIRRHLSRRNNGR
ncbi:MAG: ATP--guanido phosphotransferase [Clostridia bacterium]|nr:ATP--guanido phosphotransferase [Clostridia bacterium]